MSVASIARASLARLGVGVLAVRGPTTTVRTHTGYIPFEGRLPNIDNPQRDFYLKTRLINLQPVKKVTFKFDPFTKNCCGVRDMIAVMSTEKVRRTNPKCAFKNDVVDDGSEPTMKVELGGDNDGKRIVFEAGLLSSHEILEHFNRLVLPLVKEETEATVQSKGEKMRKAGKKSR